jgi:hypothetical protein
MDAIYEHGRVALLVLSSNKQRETVLLWWIIRFEAVYRSPHCWVSQQWHSAGTRFGFGSSFVSRPCTQARTAEQASSGRGGRMTLFLHPQQTINRPRFTQVFEAIKKLLRYSAEISQETKALVFGRRVTTRRRTLFHAG